MADLSIKALRKALREIMKNSNQWADAVEEHERKVLDKAAKAFDEAGESVTRQALQRELAQKDTEIERLKSELAKSERANRSMIDSKMTCGHPSCYGETLNEEEKK